jgi:hypothetical protein
LQFFFGEHDVGKNRADACLDQLSALNTYVQTDSYTGTLTEDFIAMFKVTEPTSFLRNEPNVRNNRCDLAAELQNRVHLITGMDCCAHQSDFAIQLPRLSSS